MPFYCTIKGQVIDQDENPRQGIAILWDPLKDGSFKKVAETDLSGNYSTRITPISNLPSEQIIKAMDKLANPTVKPFITVTVNFSIQV